MFSNTRCNRMNSSVVTSIHTPGIETAKIVDDVGT